MTPISAPRLEGRDAEIRIYTSESLPLEARVRNFSLSLNTNLSLYQDVTGLIPARYAFGLTELTGELDIYFTSPDLYEQFDADNEVWLTVELTDTQNQNLFITLPRIKFGEGSPILAGPDQDIRGRYRYVALPDENSGHIIQLDRL